MVLLLFVLAGLHAYIGWRLIPDLSLAPAAAAMAIAALLVMFVATPFVLWSRRIAAQRVANTLAWAGALAMGLFSSLFVLTVVRDLVLLAVYAIDGVSSHFSPETALRFDSALAVPILALMVTLIGFFNARRTARVVEIDIPIKDLPPALHHFTIVQVSDLHIGPTIGRRYVEAVVKAVNRLNADVVAVTGDLVDGTVAKLAHAAQPLSQLSSRHGTFFVTGNHEYYSGALDWLDHVRTLGWHTLVNEHVVLEHEGSSLVLAGVTDYSAHHYVPQHRSDPEAAISRAPERASVRVLLAHQPRSAAAAEQAGFDLQLSGHTHGGQFMPWNFLVRLQQPFTAGLNRLGRLWVYTSRGTGYWGPPKRFGAPSEISRLRLVTV